MTPNEEIRRDIDLVIDAIHTESHAKFGMYTWIDQTSCGTVACVGGTAEMVLPGLDAGSSEEEIGARLGLDAWQTEAMFYDSRREITKTHAIAALEDLKRGEGFAVGAEWDDYLYPSG